MAPARRRVPASAGAWESAAAAREAREVSEAPEVWAAAVVSVVRAAPEEVAATGAPAAPAV
ncbi:hypothetical protein GCM10009654_68000 [Streptomyces hebeiensis]|uniref:Uncharacterized protein n=1 Tax=Streptomyces hebeiensis TaxID=229486 RepID=A0ABP4FV39_9ACTN